MINELREDVLYPQEMANLYFFSITVVVQVIFHQVFNTVLKEISCVGTDMSSPFPCGDLNKLTLTV